MRIDNQGRNRTNFTSVIPVKVIGRMQTKFGEKILPATLDENITEAMRALAKLLEGRQKLKGEDHTQLMKILAYIPDYKMPVNSVPPGSVIRHYSKNGAAYLFTGPDAEAIYKSGKKLGPAKHVGLEQTGTTKTLDVLMLGQQYRNMIDSIINNASRRLKLNFMQNGKKDPAELHIYVNCQPFKNKKKETKFKFTIEQLSFREAGTPPILQRPNFPSASQTIKS